MSTAKTGLITWLLCTVVVVFSLRTMSRVLPGVIHFSNTPRLTNRELISLRNTAKRNSVIVLAVHQSDASQGSGFVIRRIGDKAVVATNAHVVMHKGCAAERVAVKAFGATSFTKADLLYAEEDKALRRDLALLVVCDPMNQLGQEIPFAGDVRRGDFVLSVGSPLNEDFAVDDGIVERVDVSSQVGNTIYHDALLEHGSSGGGLFNAKGQLVGINTYILGDGKTGVALSNGPMLNRLRLYSLKVSANTGWQNSGIHVNASDHCVAVLSQGKWSIAGLLPMVDGVGRTDDIYARYSLFPEIPHGSLLMSLDNGKSAVAIDHWWKNVIRDDSAYLSQPVKGQNANLAFRINDTDIANNAGQLDVTVLIW